MAKIHEQLKSEANLRRGQFGSGTDCMCVAGWAAKLYAGNGKGDFDGVMRKIAKCVEPNPVEADRYPMSSVITWSDKAPFEEIKRTLVRLDV